MGSAATGRASSGIPGGYINNASIQGQQNRSKVYYVDGIVNRFTYDDRYIIELNPAMRTLHGWWRVFQTSYWPKDWGGDGYRPFTILAFKIQWAIGHGNPAVFHAVNILLYAAVSVLVFVLARRVLPLWSAWHFSRSCQPWQTPRILLTTWSSHLRQPRS